MKLRIGIDVGGTFTDVTAFDEDAAALVAVRKYTSNPAQPAAVMEEITRDLAAEFGADAVSLILHGSTAALNTMLEGKGARVGLITTRGFRDVYEIGRQWRGDEVFNIFAPPPKMLLTRDRIHEVRERLDFTGKVIEPLDADDVAAAARKLIAQGVEAVAVCFLFAYANPAHEQAAAKIIRDIAPDLYVSLSHQVNPEWREYERTASTVANAYIGPPVSRYLRELEALSLRRFPRSRALMMKSDGGAASARMLASTPIETVMSGPVAGVIGGRHLGDIKGIDNIITFDTGGTSSDMAVLPGRPLFKSEVSVARHPLRTHTVDIETIGAGGGSIAAVDLGVLKVGPQSAGANPGPACYGRGGIEPTLTDALVVLGHLSPSALLEGAMPISRAKAHEAVVSRVATAARADAGRSGLGHPHRARHQRHHGDAHHHHRARLRPARVHLGAVRRHGADHRRPHHRRARHRPHPHSARSRHLQRLRHAGHRRAPDPQLHPHHPARRGKARRAGTDFRRHGRSALADLMQEQFTREQLTTLRSAGMRYRGQSYEVSVPVTELHNDADLAALAKRFHEAHRRRYGHMAESEAVEIVNFQVTAIGAIPKPQFSPIASPADYNRRYRTKRARLTSIQPTRSKCRCSAAPRLRRARSSTGPAVIEEKTSTTVLYPGQRAEIDGYLNIAVASAADA